MSKHIFLSLLAAIFFAPVVHASTLTFNSVASGDDSSWTLECTDCNMLAFFEDDGEAYDSNGNFDLDGSLSLVGSAFTPVTGNPNDLNPELTGASDEEIFLKAAATALGDSPISASFQKTESTMDPNAGSGTATDSGDYFLWKAGQYAGIAKILEIALDNEFTFTKFGNSSGLSHISHISTTTQQQPEPVPLPAGLLLLISGLGVFAVMRRRPG